MLCQNCNRSDALVHLKRIINGEAAEVHLCATCAAAFGVADAVSAFAGFEEFPGSLLSSAGARVNTKAMRCETCGFTFEDIMRTGMPGCPECYRVFSRRLRPVMTKLHGRADYQGKVPSAVKEEAVREDALGELKEKLAQAIREENFELAAVLRDEIRRLSGGVNG